MKLSPHILEEASNWFVELNGNGDIDTTTRAQFDAWLRRSPEHVHAYLQITTLWENTELLAKGRRLTSEQLVEHARADNVVSLKVPDLPLPTVPDTGISGLSGLSPVRDQSTQSPSGITPPVPDTELPYRKTVRQVRYAIAATLLLAIGASLLGWNYLTRGVYNTATGEQRSIALEDGTTIDLNSRSKLRVRYDDHRRIVELKEGQALFKVAKDPNRPFTVQSNGTEVRAVGTQFDVYRKTTGTIVTVLEGEVAVTNIQKVPGTPITGVSGLSHVHEVSVSAGQQLTVPTLAAAEACTRAQCPSEADIQLPDASANPATSTDIKPVDTTAAIAWTRRQLVFQATPLSEVVDEFNRHNKRPMKIECAARRNSSPGQERLGEVDRPSEDQECDLAATRISGVFSSTDPNTLLTFLRDLPNFHVEETPEEIRISRQ